jgi:hypothetical protein
MMANAPAGKHVGTKPINPNTNDAMAVPGISPAGDLTPGGGDNGGSGPGGDNGGEAPSDEPQRGQ